MPKAAPRPCSHPGCRSMSSQGGRCPSHQRVVARGYESTPWRRYIKSLYNSVEWIALRDSFRREHPLCIECAARGLVVMGEQVDHIIPHKGKLDLFLDRSNLQMLCRPCHSQKTMADEARLRASRVEHGPVSGRLDL